MKDPDHNNKTDEGFVERRKGGERRVNGERRSASERRHDFRDNLGKRKKNIRIWLRSLANSRLGVDRRKGERRKLADRRQRKMSALLTKEEISDLLSL